MLFVHVGELPVDLRFGHAELFRRVAVLGLPLLLTLTGGLQHPVEAGGHGPAEVIPEHTDRAPGIGHQVVEAHVDPALVVDVQRHREAEAALERLYLQRYGDRSLLHERLATAWVAAPDFHAVDAHGDSLRLSALRGRVVLLLWDAGSDIWLENGLEQLTSWYRCFEPRGLEILFMTSAQTISYSNDGSPPIRHRDTITALARERNDPFRMLFVDGETRRKYDKTPNKRPLFLVDRSGRLRLRQERIGPFDREGEEYDRIVVAKIEELLKEAPHETDADARMTNADISTKTGGTQK